MGFDGVGPSQTCLNISRAGHATGHPTEVFATRCRVGPTGVPMRVALSRLAGHLPYRWTRAAAQSRLERMFLDTVRPGDVAYLWPAASLEIHRILHERGIPVILEGINTRMASAKRILDAAYADFGIAPTHSITEARIAEEEEKYRYAQAIFAPNRHVEIALQGSPLANGYIPTSYGVDTSLGSADRETYDVGRPLTYMFCGYACVRKGVHLLLDTWRSMPPGHKLQLVGRVEPVIAERYADLLGSDRVEVVGFVGDVHEWFSRADVFVFPSLEEGGPQVVYEAAIHGLPIIASPMGAGRLEEIEGAVLCVDPNRRDAFAEALRSVAESAQLRESLGRTAKAHSSWFDWARVGARRAESLTPFMTGSAAAQ